jgi:integrase/recombinase XerD
MKSVKPTLNSTSPTWLYTEDIPKYEYFFLSKHRKKLSQTRVSNIIAEIGDKCGLETNATPHQFRRYYAQQMLKTVDLYTVSRLLGHNDIKTTQIYVRGMSDAEIVKRGMNSPLSELLR